MPRAFITHHHFVVCILLALITAGVYWQVLDHDFINFDDNGYVYDNLNVQAGINVGTIKWAFTATEESNWHPLTWLSHALDCQIYGLNPKGHHFTGLLFHILNTLLVFLVLTRMTGYPWRSAFVAALFAVHPVHIESVAWVAERKDVLSTFFWLLTMLAYAYYAGDRYCGGHPSTSSGWRTTGSGHPSTSPGWRTTGSDHPSTGSGWRATGSRWRLSKAARYLLVVLIFALGLMAKPMLVSLPLILLLLDYWPLGRLRKENDEGQFTRSSVRGLILEKVPLLALAGASCVITFVAQRDIAVAPLDKYSVGVRAANAIVAYAGYLKKMIWPVDLSVFYPHPGTSLPEWLTVVSLLVMVVLSALAFTVGRRKPYVIVGWLWYVITLVPVIGLVQVGNQAMADRYTYVPLLGIFIIAAWGIPDLFSRSESVKMSRQARRRQKMEKTASPEPMRLDLAVPAVILTIVLMVCTHNHLAHWRDSITLFSNTLKLFPNDSAAYVIVANAMQEKGMDEGAIEHYRKAVALKTEHPDARLNLAILLSKHGYRDEAEQHYREILRVQPNHVQAQANYGHLLIEKGQRQEAIKHLRQAIRGNPDHAQSYYNLAYALQHDGRNMEAAEHYLQAIKLKPDYTAARENLAIVYYGQGKYADAWREVKASRKYGGTPNPDFVRALSEGMAEPAD